ncbi:MAG: decaprenyl-phosphate phosphoribosyltransferase [Kofleriaceae bacterium]|nr:decaprenyl-phosphate phosphoribosyltransferase [Kofleriaceae bacterium]
MGSATALIKTLRPHQWVKNLFVAAALVFSRHLTDPQYVIRTALAVLAFCLLSGAVYAFNDVRDVESDRVHPTKRHRPIASGALSERAALSWAFVLAIVALTGCAVLSWQLAVFAALYALQNVAYSVRLKHIAFVDVGVIATGFLLRVLGGAAAIDVPASKWLLVCTALLAIFLGLGKRAHELAWAERSGQTTETRAALAGYRLPVVRVTMILIGIATCASYVAYTVSPHTIAFFGTDRLAYSTPFVALGILRFLFLALWWPKDDSPTEAMLKDPWFLLDLVAATATLLYIIYG